MGRASCTIAGSPEVAKIANQQRGIGKRSIPSLSSFTSIPPAPDYCTFTPAIGGSLCNNRFPHWPASTEHHYVPLP
ncbi:hypothetical protein AA0116_g3661 [Alternaria tenuissima]|nr:hypothetical protein AA0116_g3661 [Alternaria tenuissima]